MRDDRFLFGDWWFKNDAVQRTQFYIQRISTVGAKREKVQYDTSTDITLFGCDKDRNLLYYAVDFPAMPPTLWAAFVEEDGSLSGKQSVADLPPGVWAHPITQDGNLYYTVRNLGNSNYWHGRITESGAEYVGPGKAWTFDWTDDGRLRADLAGASEIAITDTETGDVRTVDIGHMPWTLAWFPDGDRFLTSRWPNTDRGDQTTRSWIHDASTGTVVDSLDGVRAFATSADGEAIIFGEVTGDGVCVTSMRLADHSRNHLKCFPEATAVPPTFNAWEMSRSRELIWLNYGTSDSTNTYRIVSLDGSVDYILREGELNRNIEFLPDDSGAIIIEKTALFFFDFKTGIESKLAYGLPPNMYHQFYGWKLHPDGVRFTARLGTRPQTESGLTVINNVVGLVDGVK